MLIGELSGKTGLSRDTIRFYEKRGLIPVGRKENRFNNYKEYSGETARRLLVIKRMKSFGFTLNEIADFLKFLNLEAASCESVSEKMLSKIKLIDEKIQELYDMKGTIINALKSCKPPGTENGNCALLKVSGQE